VTKTAETSFTRTFQWDIDKSVTPETWDLFTGDSGTSRYTVAVEKTGFTDSDWAVEGEITIHNPAPDSATITDVTDEVSGVEAATVDCGVSFPYVLAAGDDLVCTYGPLSLPNGDSRTNTATATTSGDVDGDAGTADVSFGDPTTLVNDSINVTDTNGESWGPVSDNTSWQYDRTFTCDGDEGTHDNTATITETGQSDDASVTVNCYALAVTKDAATSLTRTWNWTISKSVTPETWDLFTGDSGTSAYTVEVDKVDFTDSQWAVAGNINVDNPAPIGATINGVADIVSPAIAASVDCGVAFPHTLGAGESLACTYGTALPDASDRTNTATATLQNYDYDFEGNGTPSGTTDFSHTVGVSFANATVTEVNTEISVTDTNGEAWGPVSDDTTWTYDRTFTCDGDEGEHNNTATITETGQNDSATVTVNCYALAVTKDAATSLTRTWTWDIDKSADQTSLTLSSGQLFQVNYEVIVSAASVDSAWAVAGNISIDNPAPIDATINSVSDIVSPDIAASVNCGVSFPYTLVANGNLACTYSADLPNDEGHTNTATATLQNFDYDSSGVGTPDGTTDFSHTVDVSFANATVNEIDECIDVTDTNVGSLGTVCAGDAPQTFTYSLQFGQHPDADVQLECGENTHTNVASFITNDTGSTGEDDATVTADVACQFGCTLTPGYWKTHSINGPAPYDDTWAQIGEDTIFFLSGKSYYDVLWTPPKGNAYYILAHAYIAAELNFLNGADSTDAQDAFDDATVLFQTYTPAQVANLKGAAKKTWTDLATILDDYNNGEIGPGHCSEDVTSSGLAVSDEVTPRLFVPVLYAAPSDL
jgi:hypothetical protein